MWRFRRKTAEIRWTRRKAQIVRWLEYFRNCIEHKTIYHDATYLRLNSDFSIQADILHYIPR